MFIFCVDFFFELLRQVPQLENNYTLKYPGTSALLCVGNGEFGSFFIRMSTLENSAYTFYYSRILCVCFSGRYI